MNPESDEVAAVQRPAENGQPCTYRFKTECPNMKGREGCTDMSYEHYDCKVCGAHVALDYDEMR